LGGRRVLAAIRASGGTAIAISDQDLLEAGILMARTTGIFPAPEGGACVAAARRLVREGFLKPGEQVVAFNTGSGLKYLEAYATRFPRYAAREADKLGGLITPR
jgi:threonine synthase